MSDREFTEYGVQPFNGGPVLDQDDIDSAYEFAAMIPGYRPVSREVVWSATDWTPLPFGGAA